MKISDTLSLTTTKDVLEALVSADEAPKRAMLAIGYAGWGAGQLENEIMDNAWLLLEGDEDLICLLYTSPSPRDQRGSRMPSSA